MPLARIGVDPAVVDTRRRHRHRTSGGQHIALVVIAITDHQTVAVLVDLVGELLDIGSDFSRNATAS